MGANAILLGYQARLVALYSTAAQLRSGQMVALAAMSLAIAAIVVIASFSLTKHTIPFVSALVPLPLAVYAGRISKRRTASLLQTFRLEKYYERGVDRLEGRWAGSGVKGDEYAGVGHCYDKDLNVFGEGSLFELLCTCRTEVGRRQLANFLVETPSLQESMRRQEAVQELRAMSELCEQIQLLGEFSFEQSTWETIMEWLAAPIVRAPQWFRFAALGASVSLGVLLLLGIASVVTWGHLGLWIGLLLLSNGAFGLLYRRRVLSAMQGIQTVGCEIGLLRQGLSLLQAQKFRSVLLNELAQSASESDAGARVHKLERLIGALIERDKEWFYGIARGLLIGTQVFFAIERWRAKNAEPMRRWLSAWGELEALMALANYSHEHPEHCFPQFEEGKAMIDGKGLGHPLLPADECVRNDISLGENRRLYVISGSNMAGKSTLLRTIGLNVILAYAGAPVCAERLVLSRFSLCASLAIQDSLLNRKSKFLAEIDRLRQALETPADEGPVLFLIDEILSGTNSKDRRTAAEAILRALIGRGAMGALSTHDLALTELAELPDLRGTNVHMGYRDDSDPLDFDYLVKPGVTNQSSALAIARLAGVVV